MAIIIEASRVLTGSRRTTARLIDMVKCIYWRPCGEESLSRRRDCRRANYEFATETREELYYDKDSVLGWGSLGD